MEVSVLLFCPFREAHIPRSPAQGWKQSDQSGKIYRTNLWIKDDFFHTPLESLLTHLFLCYPLFSQLVLMYFRHSPTPNVNLFMPCETSKYLSTRRYNRQRIPLLLMLGPFLTLPVKFNRLSWESVCARLRGGGSYLRIYQQRNDLTKYLHSCHPFNMTDPCSLLDSQPVSCHVWTSSPAVPLLRQWSILLAIYRQTSWDWILITTI